MEEIISTEYSEIMQKSYIDYAMSVIISVPIMTGPIVNPPVSWAIPWVNIIRTETARSMKRLL